MALRDFFRGGRRERDDDRQRYPLDPLSRDSWRDESEARYGAHRDYEEDRRNFNDRWQSSYSGAGYGRFSDEERGGYGRSPDEDRGETRYGGSGGNPFYGQRPLLNAGSDYDTSYFGSKAGLPKTQYGPDDTRHMDDLVYGGRSFDADASAASQSRGRFSGQGPRGYRRSDERIKEDVCQCLTDDEHIDASNIEVAVNDREVVLTGSVGSRMQKRHAEDLIERLPGVRDVINSLRVVSETQATQSTMGTQSITRTSYR